jgi:hypothetical protein
LKLSTCVLYHFLPSNTHPTCFSLHILIHRKQGIQTALRSSLAHIRSERIPPTVLTAPSTGFVPPPQGVGLPFPPTAPTPVAPSDPSTSTGSGSGSGNDGDKKPKAKTRGLLEERVERDAWRGVLDALGRLRDARRAEVAAEAEGRRVEDQDGDTYMSLAK